MRLFLALAAPISHSHFRTRQGSRLSAKRLGPSNSWPQGSVFRRHPKDLMGILQARQRRVDIRHRSVTRPLGMTVVINQDMNMQVALKPSPASKSIALLPTAVIVTHPNLEATVQTQCHVCLLYFLQLGWSQYT